jgi:Uma2 family endonuclease
MTALLKKDVEYTLEEYIELEKSSEERFEFFDGNVWAMARASIDHESIISNLDFSLRSQFQGRSYRVFLSNTRVKVPIYPPYRYPDLSALCGRPNIENLVGLEILTNPSLVVEVLSDSTKSFVIGDKFTYYKSIESFTEYLLIDQDRPHVVLYTKRDEKVWLHQEFNSLDESVYLTSLECEINLTDIYENIEFPIVEFPMFPFQNPNRETA